MALPLANPQPAPRRTDVLAFYFFMGVVALSVVVLLLFALSI